MPAARRKRRPKKLASHHGRGRHRGNYADLPVIDMLFGTFENPRGFHGRTGFYDGASARLGDLLLGRDVSVPAKERAELTRETLGITQS